MPDPSMSFETVILIMLAGLVLEAITNLAMDIIGGFLPGNLIGGLTGRTVASWIIGLAFGYYLVETAGADLIGTLTGGALAGKTIANILVIKISGDVMAGVRKRYM
jgi:hypothetical protein